MDQRRDVISEVDIDRLYQVAPGEFVAARNTLAARAGDRKAEIRGLEKPNAAAWGVNQLYWSRRKVFDRLTTAFDHVRSAQTRRLAGQPADVSKAEVAHRAALDRALAEIRRLLNAAGDAASVSTMTAVAETLQAVPFSAFAGRLSRPLAPAGFGALAGLLGSTPPVRPAADVVPITRGRRDNRSASDDEEDERQRQQAAERHRRAVEDAQARLATAQRDMRTAETLAARMDTESDVARSARDRLRADLDAADEHLRQKRGAAVHAAKAVREARATVDQLERELERCRAATGPAGR